MHFATISSLEENFRFVNPIPATAVEFSPVATGLRKPVIAMEMSRSYLREEEHKIPTSKFVYLLVSINIKKRG